MRTAKSVLAGDLIYQFLDITPTETPRTLSDAQDDNPSSDLTIHCPKGKAWIMLDHMKNHQDYDVHYNILTDDISAHWKASIHSAVVLMKNNMCVTIVASVNECPVYPIFHKRTTCEFAWITPDHLFCANPALTYDKREYRINTMGAAVGMEGDTGNLTTGNGLTETVDPCTFHSEVGMCNECSGGIHCALLERATNDDISCLIVFDENDRLRRPHSQALRDYNAMVEWCIGGWRDIAGKTILIPGFVRFSPNKKNTF